MKKKGKNKKKIVATIALATVAASCISAVPATSLANNSLHNYGVVRAYAAEEQNSSLKTWQDSIAKLNSGDITTYSNYVNYVMDFKTARDAYRSVSASITAEEQLVYDAASALVAIDADYYDYVASTLYNLKATEGFKWSLKAEYDNQTSRFSTLDAERQGWLIKLIGTEDYNELTTYAENEFDRIQAKMDAVEEAIDAIEYKGKVDSKASLDVVAAAVKEVYGVEYAEIAETEVKAMADYIGDGKLAIYDEACAEYDAIVAECKAFDAKIIATYNDFTASKKYYTESEVIETLHADYLSLNKGANDDRKTLITESAKIDELLEKVEAVKGSIAELEAKIAEIPTEFDYEGGYIAKVVAAREYCDINIIADVVKSEIEGYDFLCETEAKIAECKKAVDDLITRANNLQALLDANSPDFVKEVNAVVAARATFAYDKQLADFNAECGELVASMRSKVANINATVTPVIEAIDAIGEVKLSDTDIGARINYARTLYNALATDIEKASVSNYNKLVKAEEALDALTQDALDWKVAVDAIVIDGKITVANIEAIDAVEATYDGWVALGGDKADLAQVVANGGSQFSYDKYTSLVADRDALLGSIATLATDMAAISTDLEVISDEPTVFTGAVEAAKTAFEALDTTVQAQYFADENAANKAAYDNYVSALNLYNNVYKLVGNIIALDDVNMAKYVSIYAYLDEYATLSDENKAIVDNGGYKAKLDTAKATVDALKEKRDAWIEEVYALAGDVEKADWEDKLYSVDLDAVATLVQEASELDNTDNGLDDVVEDFEKIIKIGQKRIDDMNASIATLAAKPSLEKADIETLKEIYNIYNEELHTTQQEKVNYDVFSPLYNRYVFAQNFDEAVDALYKDVVDGKNFTSEVPVVVGVLRSVYVSMNDEMKQLIERYADIQKIEDAYVAFVADGGKVLNLTAVYEELYEMIETVNDADFAAQIKAVADDLKALDDATKQAVADLEEAYKKADGIINGSIEEIKKALGDLTTQVKANTDAIAAVDGKITDAISALETKLNGVIDQVKKELADADTANKTELLGKITALEGKLATLQADFDAYKVAVEGLFAGVDADIEALESALATLETEINAEIEDIAKEIEALEKADVSLKNEIDSLRKSLTTVTVILSIVSGLSSIGVIILFVKKKKD